MRHCASSILGLVSECFNRSLLICHDKASSPLSGDVLLACPTSVITVTSYSSNAAMEAHEKL